MRFAPVRHMAWAKRHQQVAPPRIDLTTSAVAPATWADLGGLPPDLPLAGANPYGHPGLLARIAARYGKAPEHALTTSGSSMANFLVIAACVQPGDRVVIEHPVYEPLVRAVEALGGALVRVSRREEDGWRLDPEALDRACRGGAALVILTQLHNPTGAALDAVTLQAAARSAERAGAYLLVDEVYRDGAFALAEPPPLAATLSERAVSTSSFNKIYGLGSLRSGWAVGDRPLLDRLRIVRDTLDAQGPYLVDAVSLQAWDRREALWARARGRFLANWPVVAAWLERHEDWACVPPAGGFVCLARLPETADPERFHRVLMERHGCAVTPGDFFGAPRHVRIGFGGDAALLAQGLEAMADAAAR